MAMRIILMSAFLSFGMACVHASPALLTPEAHKAIAIQNYHQKMQEHIDDCLKYSKQDNDDPQDYFCRYYHSVLHDNDRDKPVSGIGKSIITTHFWYDSIAEEDEEVQMYKISQKYWVADRIVETEFVFKDNKLVYFFEKNGNIMNADGEVHLFFQDEKLIQANPVSATESVKSVIKRAKKLVQVPQLYNIQ